MPIGPQLPPSAEKRKRSLDDDNSDSDDGVGPQLPPSKPEDPKLKKPRTIGPSLPPTVTPTEPSKPEDVDDSDDDEDDFGPALPSSNTTKDKSINDSKSTKQLKSTIPLPAPAEPKIARDEWMTMAPKSGDWSQRVDPTKLKSRKFNTGRSSTHQQPGSTSGGDSWHETPEQKQARLQRQVLGTKNKDNNSEGVATKSADTISAEDLETARRMKEYNESRGPSLYDAHQKKHQDGAADDDPSARAFDKEKDMGAGSQLNSTQRREMLKKSANFSSRFSSARYL